MSVLRPLDPVYFHHDVIKTLDAVNQQPYRTFFAEVFIKIPSQLTLACFSAVTAVLAAVREIFVVIGALFITVGSLVIEGTRAIFHKREKDHPIRGCQTLLHHTFRAGAELLAASIALLGGLLVLFNGTKWVVSKNIQLTNYQPAEERELLVAPLPNLPNREEFLSPPPPPRTPSPVA